MIFYVSSWYSRRYLLYTGWLKKKLRTFGEPLRLNKVWLELEVNFIRKRILWLKFLGINYNFLNLVRHLSSYKLLKSKLTFRRVQKTFNKRVTRYFYCLFIAESNHCQWFPHRWAQISPTNQWCNSCLGIFYNQRMIYSFFIILKVDFYLFLSLSVP